MAHLYGNLRGIESHMKVFAGILIVVASLLGCLAKAQDTIVFQGISMLPSIQNDEKIRIEKFDRGAEFTVKRGDVVVFLYPEDTSKVYIKRVVGLPNETVEIRVGKVFIDGKELDEPYVETKFNEVRGSRQPVNVGADHFYVLGDNRDNSADSRIWGTIPKKNLLAKVLDK